MFKRSNIRAYARATTMMSTQSATGFEWSVKLIGTHFYVGIASKLQPRILICHYDPEAILYHSPGISPRHRISPDIRRGSTLIHSCQGTLQSGDVVRFKFQPDAKKLIIYLVRDSSSTNV